MHSTEQEERIEEQ
ncbi:hypothetical protein TIFTF001_056127 [Ficus carica]|nr:hypothetical protein TIFTF001_044346 [Ficus carica]GMN44781.1 hypothetical protein TIFTF001_013986 [Ficus carica]GMN73243.1 hypothetical protein TIFTF001_054294 [Ficus carica]GMN73695.1 hypothetical protein TIFTF001_056125 [Ficus carica]GMN73708.1 hypothetical protein TIFTF001_056127 [Ficus carica]